MLIGKQLVQGADDKQKSLLGVKQRPILSTSQRPIVSTFSVF